MLTIYPINLKAACLYVQQMHRHHGPTRGHKFSVSLIDDAGMLHGVAIAGRPVARALDNGVTIEILRVATDESRNACSMLYGACWRAARALGYRRGITYTLASESGVSLRAAGWTRVADVDGDLGTVHHVDASTNTPQRTKCDGKSTRRRRDRDASRDERGKVSRRRRIRVA
jgi:hypothetical protein